MTTKRKFWTKDRRFWLELAGLFLATFLFWLGIDAALGAFQDQWPAWRHLVAIAGHLIAAAAWWTFLLCCIKWMCRHG